MPTSVPMYPTTTENAIQQRTGGFMNYSMTTFDKAVEKLLPNIAKAKDMGVMFDRPTLVNMVAQQHFVSDWDDRRDYEQQMAYHVVKQAAIELKSDGFITFGDVEYDFL